MSVTADKTDADIGSIEVSKAAKPAPPPPHPQLINDQQPLLTQDGRSIQVWQLVVPGHPAHLSEWAKAFRQHYCLDSEIDELRNGTGLSRSQFLEQLVFPDKAQKPGPSIRAGDFAELLVTDYVDYLRGYWVPRGKYAEKAARNESVKGVDILGFKQLLSGQSSPSDELLTFEVKAQLSGSECAGRLQVAIDHSCQDFLRLAVTLHATKRRLKRVGDEIHALLVERFQNPTDHPYVYRSGAAAVITDAVFDPASIQLSSCANHPNQQNLELIVIRGADLMMLTHALYERAAHEA